MDVVNCPNCGTLFVKMKFKDVCDACYKEEEAEFEKVYQFIRKSKNRTAYITQVVEATGVDEALIIKYIKNGRLRMSKFPNLGYPCEQCGNLIKSGRICDDCAHVFRSELSAFEKEEQRQREIKEKEKEKEKKVTYLRKG